MKNSEVVIDALKKSRVVGLEEDIDPEFFNVGVRQLNRMLKSWQNRGICKWLTANQTVTLAASATQTLSPARPLDILEVTYKLGGIETPMEQLTRVEYQRLPNKTVEGRPTTYHYDRQKEAGALFVWPVPSASSTGTLEVTYIREIEDVVASNDTDFPMEWADAVVYNLAARLSDEFNQQNVTVRTTAMQLLEDAMAFDGEGSVFFAGEQA